MFTRLKKALAELDAAFPAGDYRLNSWQNAALNAILDLSSEMSERIPSYGRRVKTARQRVLSEMMARVGSRISALEKTRN